jgi:hypothetical protein
LKTKRSENMLKPVFLRAVLPKVCN